MNLIEKYQYYLPSYEDCRAICDKYDDFQLYEGISFVDGYKICTFNYRLIGYNDFLYPLGEDSQVKAFELRGITFVFNEDGTLYKRYLLMNKFFNLNQVDETQYHLIKEIPIKYVHDKCDGSVINFIKLPNGKILPKSKMCVDNEQAMCAKEIVDANPAIKKMVEWALERDIMPIMEYVSPKNRVVLKYKKSELILLRFRDLISGEYLELETYPEVSELKTAKIEPYSTWDEIIPLMATLKDKEGGVATLANGMMIKWKTVWYCDLHHTLTESIHREDFLIEKVIDEEIDDVIGQVDPDDKEVLAIIDNVIHVTTNYLLAASKLVDVKVKFFHENCKGSRKDFVLTYGKKDKYFSYAMLVIDNRETALTAVAKDLKKFTSKLEQARTFIKDADF
jgi:T4 RnlA family RNA ligase